MFRDRLPRALLLTVAAMARIAAAAEAPASLSGRIVVFGHQPIGAETSDNAIVSMCPDGSDLRTEVTVGSGMNAGVVAPDGKSLAYGAYDPATQLNNVWVKRPDSPPVIVARDLVLHAWHPSASKLLCYRDADGKYENFIVDLDSGTIQFVEFESPTVAQSWNFDGSRLIAIAMNPGRRYLDPVRGSYPLRQLCLWNPVDRTQSAFTGSDHDCIWPVCSPDGRHIAFYLRRHTDKPHEILAVANADGSDAREVAEVIERLEGLAIRPLGFPRWSPDGQEVAWMRDINRLGTSERTYELLFVSTADGRTVRRLPLDPQFSWGRFDWAR